MRRDRSALNWTIAAVGVLGVLCAWVLLGSERSEVNERVYEAAAVLELAPEAVPSAVAELGAEHIEIQYATGSRETVNRVEIGERLASWIAAHGTRVVDIQHLEVRVSDGRARVRALAIISETQVGDLHAEQREVAATLIQEDAWRIRSLTLGTPRKHLPEARP